MKEQGEQIAGEQQQSQVQQIQEAVQQVIRQPQRKIQYPSQQYTVNEIYSIRKQSSNMANDHIYKKLTKSFHRIKKMRSQPNGSALISKQFDYENNAIRLGLKRVHELYNLSTKTNMIVKRKIDKMRNKVDRIKGEVQNSQIFLVSDVDINKIYARNNQTPTQQGAINASLQKPPSK